jgi:hypothetical protein
LAKATKKKKKDVSPEAAAQAEAMKHRLEELAAQRRERESSTQGRSAGGGWTPGGVEPHQIRSGRRGNR